MLSTPQQVQSNRSCQELVELLQAQNCSPKIIKALQDYDCDEFMLLNCDEEILLQELKLNRIQLCALMRFVAKTSSSSSGGSSSNRFQLTNNKTPPPQTILNVLKHVNQGQESEEHTVTTTIEPAVQKHDKKSAIEGNSGARTMLGAKYRYGCKKSIEQEFKGFEKAANQGDAIIQFCSDETYCKGEEECVEKCAKDDATFGFSIRSKPSYSNNNELYNLLPIKPEYKEEETNDSYADLLKTLDGDDDDHDHQQ